MQKHILLLFLFVSSIVLAQQNSNMALVPGGEFIMGNDMKNSLGFSPAHLVKVDSFYIDKYEVTNKDYLKFCQETKHRLPEFWNTDIFRCGDKYLNYPVVGISFGDAMAYAKWAGKRLPTEAEWEYAARGELEGKNFPHGDTWHQERAKQDSTGWKNLIEPVGQYEVNAYGLYDMSGNVWEWVADRHSESYYQQRVYDNPKGPAQGTNRVIRGGSWHSGKMCKKVFYRKGLIANWSDFAVGFRCAKDVE
ncbi:formylglycine-generating enzyme family protein [Labilibacter marinus]|uniref:formylglycine-generating enzyme family protein n=1 Tax=Labilibacter marinus TaxID=1477105 RepID=UPI00095001DE|nr:formylglycine-generating enzyme family protein [Labilibacter marinus]